MASIRPKLLGNGKKAYQVRWYDPDGREKSETFAKHAEAKDRKTRIESDLARGTYIDPRAGRITFKEFAEDWRVKQSHYAETSARRLEIALRLHIYPHIGAMSLRAIRRSDIQAMVGNWNAAVARKYLGFVSVVFTAAVLDEVIPTSPVRSITTARPASGDLIIPTVAQVHSIAGAVGPWGEAVIIAASTGLRYAELHALTLDSIDLDARTVRVRPDVGQVVWPTGKRATLAPPKTPAAARVIPVGHVAREALQRQIDAATPDRGDGFGGLLFASNRRNDGGPLSMTTIAQRLRPAMIDAGFPPGTGLHVFRHFYASALIQAGESVKVVQKRLGHTSALETLDTYGHLWPESEESSRSAIDEAFGPLLRIAG